jgi:hypothetical protein
MIEIDVKNTRFDFTLFSKSEIISLKKQKLINIIENDERTQNDTFEIINSNLKVNYHRNQNILVEPRENIPFILYFDDNELNTIDYYIEKYSNNKSYLIIIVSVSCGESFIFERKRDVEFEYKEKLKKINNFYLIHFEPFFLQDRCFFNQKIALQNLLGFVPSVGAYHHMHDYFNLIKKNKRIGFHLNRINQSIRVNWLRVMLKNDLYKNDKIYFTLNKFAINNHWDETINIKNDFGDDIFDKIPSNDTFGIHTWEDFYLEDWYLPNLFDLSLKSDIEIVYETTMREELEFINYTEKTIKHIMLGKPVYFTDPMAYSLLNYYGYKNYDCLYTKEILEIYKNFNFNDKSSPRIFQNMEKDMINLHHENIKWLLEMPNEEWENIKEICNQIGKENHNKMDKVLFEETIMDNIKNIIDINNKQNTI